MIVLIVAIAVLATLLFVYAAAVLLARRQPALERRLAGYERAVDEAAPTSSETAVMQQAVDFAGGIAERAGLLSRIERALEQAALPVRASELVFYVPVFGILAFLLLTILLGPLWGLLGALIVGIVPVSYVSNKSRGRTRAFERQLPDTLTLLASSLRAGFSFMQGLESVSQEIGEPTRSELQRVFTEVRLGRAVEDALGDAADRMKSQDLAWTVQAIRIQREIGGNLATLLDTVADTMKKREMVRREISALTAEGRLSAIILSLMPLIVGGALFVMQPSYMGHLTSSFFGIASLIFAGVMMVVGWFWLQRIINIEV